MKKVIIVLASFLAGIFVTGCSKGVYDLGRDGDISDYKDGSSYAVADGEGPMEGIGGEGNGSSGNTSSGIVTAGEWRDLDHWLFWSGLMTTQGEDGFSEMPSYWGFYVNQLVAVKYVQEERPVIGAKVELSRNGKVVWTAKTDNKGFAYTWVSPFQELNEVSPDELTVIIEGSEMAGHPELTSWTSQTEVKINQYQKMTADAQPMISNKTDIAFIVDATGSMDDEIRFLKDDLVDILGKATEKANGISVLRTAAVFYRDEGDQYVTRYDDFKTNVASTVEFIKEQNADGGGDYPEAVHTALEASLQKLSWGEDSRMRVAFLLLDAPAHHNQAVIASLQQSIETYARLGIRIIPIAASGADKNTEFMLRFFANLTGGTYTFLTNDSGVGGDHIVASVGEYEVEQLNELIVRLIAGYLD